LGGQPPDDFSTFYFLKIEYSSKKLLAHVFLFRRAFWAQQYFYLIFWTKIRILKNKNCHQIRIRNDTLERHQRSNTRLGYLTFINFY
jgi:hypothetical protein